MAMALSACLLLQQGICFPPRLQAATSSYGMVQNPQNPYWRHKCYPRQPLHEYCYSSSPLPNTAHEEMLLPSLKSLTQFPQLHELVSRVRKARRTSFTLSCATSSSTTTLLGSQASNNLRSRSYNTSFGTIDSSIVWLGYGGGGSGGVSRVSMPIEGVVVVRKGDRLGVSQIRAHNTINSESEEDPWQREERRWLREEQRWLREEERWLREQARWELERQRSEEETERLKNELESLRHKLDLATVSQQEEVGAAPRLSDLVDIIEKFRAVAGATQGGLETLGTTERKRVNNILGDGAKRITLPDGALLHREDTMDDSVGFTGSTNSTDTASDDQALSFMSESSPRAGTGTEPELGTGTAARKGAAWKTTAPSTTAVGNDALTVNGHGRADGGAEPARRTLRFGAKGDEVKLLQEALGSEGFYCGEEEMEFCMFDRGTERALKTYQSSMGMKEDGAATAEVWARLLGVEVGDSQQTAKPSEESATENKSRSSSNETAVARTEANRYVAQTEFVEKVEEVVEEKRVYLLGEGRWEQPARLRKNTQTTTSTLSSNSNEAKKAIKLCFACRGEGLMLCAECQGTGELNVEEQFLEWAGEDPICPYCDGTGSVACDVCGGAGHEPNLSAA